MPFPPAPTDTIPQGEHILVVDDDPEVAESVALLLRENGYKVEVAHSAEEACESVCKLRPILAITDDVVPGAGGLELMQRFRYSHAHHNIPLIRLGQYVAPSIIGHETQPFDVWLFKPFNPNELLSFVRRILAFPVIQPPR